MTIAELIEMMRKRGPVDPAKVKEESEAYQAQEAPNAIAEEGIEEGDLTDYAPQGLVKGAIRKMTKGKLPATTITKDRVKAPTISKDTDVMDSELFESLARAKKREAEGKAPSGYYRKLIEKMKNKRPDIFGKEE